MDNLQLRQLAERVRSFLSNANHRVSYNQSLDLIAALPGLRNWPEVESFPDRVTACELNTRSAIRLAHRLKRKFEMDLSPLEVLAALNPQQHSKKGGRVVPEIWPAGPAPGVYVTTSQAAINALVAKYEEATDGALLYAESAANGVEAAIELGEWGLWSAGLDRVPSGTLIVVGPIELAQDEWERSSDRVLVGCTHAGLSNHRVAILARTPTPDDLCEDIRVMAKNEEDVSNYCDPALVGVVTEGGELVQRVPFARSRPAVKTQPSIAAPDAIPEPARTLLTQALQGRKSGLLILGGDSVQEHWAADLVDAALALTETAGPAARIMPRFRTNPAKDWNVPDATKQLPFVPSIESAYDRGYRRMIFDPHSTDGKILQKFADEVLFIAGTHEHEVGSIIYGGIRGTSAQQELELATRIIALLGVMRLDTKQGVRPIADLFLGSDAFPPDFSRKKEIGEYVTQSRALKWEDEVQCLIDRGEVTLTELEGVHMRSSILEQLKAQLGAQHTEH
jgi:hypothetical protein